MTNTLRRFARHIARIIVGPVSRPTYTREGHVSPLAFDGTPRKVVTFK